MSIRQWLNSHAVSVTIGTVLCLGLALLVILTQAAGFGSGGGTAYYWHLDTGDVFVAPGDQMPPIEAPSGGAAVRAHLYSCGPCDPEHWFGYLETYDRQIAEQFAGGPIPPAPMEGALGERHRLRLIDDDRWIPAHGPEADRLLAELEERCGDDRRPTACLP